MIPAVPGRPALSSALAVSTNSCPAANEADLSHPWRAIRTCSMYIAFRSCSRGSWGSDIYSSNRRTMSLVVLIKTRQDCPMVCCVIRVQTQDVRPSAASLPFATPLFFTSLDENSRYPRILDVELRNYALLLFSRLPSKPPFSFLRSINEIRPDGFRNGRV